MDDLEFVRARIQSVKQWYHQIEIRPGIVTPGIENPRLVLDLLSLPADCQGLRVLDLGTRDGFFAFELERRGAQVLAIDNASPDETGFNVARELLQSHVTFYQADIYNLMPAEYGTFDIVLFLGLLYHLPDPMRAIAIARALCRDRLYLETQVIDHAFLMPDATFRNLASIAPELEEIPLMQFYPGDALMHDPTNWWAPNLRGAEAMLVENGFVVESKAKVGMRGLFNCRLAPNAQAHLPLRVVDAKPDLLALQMQLEETRARTSALTTRLAEQSRVMATRDEAIAWLQAELGNAQYELQVVKRSRFWKFRDAYWQMRNNVRRTVQRLFSLSRQTRSPDKLADTNNETPAWDSERFSLPPAPDRADEYSVLTIAPALTPDTRAAILNAPPRIETRRADIVCFSIIEWWFRYQRPQQIMSQFAAQGHRVFYLSTAHFLPRDAHPRFRVREIKANLYEVVLAAPRPLQLYQQIISGADLEGIYASLDALCQEYLIQDALGYLMLVAWGPLARRAQTQWGWHLIYDCMDDWEHFPGMGPSLAALEPQVVQHADLLVVTGQRLYEKWQNAQPSIVLARNAVDFDFYATQLRPNDLLRESKHPIIGYFGAIAQWFDIQLMAYVAAQRPDYTFVLIGGIFDVDVSALQQLPNVQLLGQQPYQTMPQYLYHFDVCLIPFQINSITQATDPVKFYEYLCAGRPIVTTDLQELAPYREYLYIAKSREEFVMLLDAAIAEHDPARTTARQQVARANTWHMRYQQIMAGVEHIMPCASIIIVTYNNLELTKLCVESIFRNTTYPNYELILVDNNSSDGTRAYLQDLAARCPEIQVIQNAQNYGFAHANNQGLLRARGKYLVLLNNDTIVPFGWLGRLLHHLKDPQVGLVGPVTNFAGNEACVSASYKTWNQMESFARARAQLYAGQSANIAVLAMFCVAFTRQIYQEIGPLDEQFGTGLFEDDDYTLRVRQNGYDIVCALDTFVHHFGRSAFKQLIQDGTYNTLFDANLRRYETKWNVKWMPHRHGTLTPRRPAHWGEE